MRCTDCGLLEQKDPAGFCVRFKQVPDKVKTHCMYFLPLQYEDGRPLSPLQHLILQDEVLRRKKMRGPV